MCQCFLLNALAFSKGFANGSAVGALQCSLAEDLRFSWSKHIQTYIFVDIFRMYRNFYDVCWSCWSSIGPARLNWSILRGELLHRFASQPSGHAPHRGRCQDLKRCVSWTTQAVCKYMQICNNIHDYACMIMHVMYTFWISCTVYNITN